MSAILTSPDITTIRIDINRVVIRVLRWRHSWRDGSLEVGVLLSGLPTSYAAAVSKP